MTAEENNKSKKTSIALSEENSLEIKKIAKELGNEKYVTRIVNALLSSLSYEKKMSIASELTFDERLYDAFKDPKVKAQIEEILKKK